MDHIQSIGQVSFKLKEQHDFNWLNRLGHVFCVFAEQDSGNISFGVENNGRKIFVKYAGARTLEYSGKPGDAIQNVRNSIPVYENLKHGHLIQLLDHFEVENGYALVFEWFEGECLHSHWSFPPPHKYHHPDSPFFRFKQLPVNQRLEALRSIYEFHVHVEKNNYVAVDFYDGSILYDFRNHITKICDIDLYKQKPFINTMGRLWGSSRFMAPEEFEFGGEIDGQTNVFNMGAIAFGLLGGELDRSILKWDAGQELYEIALRAVNKEKKDRYSTVEEFFFYWENTSKNFISQN
ncbi:serine/threonine protein kinase [Bacillus sp. SA1-12]|uniref:protein kinase domain-containing protein n=1 Tax=Bacillus sp. SA1-12 TaxID=1455638 RepID=UPI0006270C18|nr:serine/threonine protein kinase [Bacillus sp. SA1-12]KKI90418.1 serine/threonine protein kinase [Bacillus sp. SA1-12]